MNNKDLRELCDLIKYGNEDACREVLELFTPLLYKNSFIDGAFDEDIFQELSITLIECIKNFKINAQEDLSYYLHNYRKADH